MVVKKCITCLNLMKLVAWGYACTVLREEFRLDETLCETDCSEWVSVNNTLCYRNDCIQEASFIQLYLPCIFPVCKNHLRRDIVHIPIYITTERTIEHLKETIVSLLTLTERDAFYKIQTLDSVLIESLSDEHTGALGRLQTNHLIIIFKLYKYVTRRKIKMFKAVRINEDIKLTDFFRRPPDWLQK